MTKLTANNVKFSRSVGTANTDYFYVDTGVYTTATLLRTMNNPNAYSTSTLDSLGNRAISMSGKYAIVGAYDEDDAGGAAAGKAYIFDVTTGNLLHTLDNPNAFSTSAGDRFGYSVAISGNYAVVGAHQEDESGYSDSGKVYIFDVITGNLLHTLDDPNAHSTPQVDNFGNSMAISGNYVIIGANQEDKNGNNYNGKAYIFDVISGNLVATLDNPNVYSSFLGDGFGWNVDIHNDLAIVSAPGESISTAGAVGKAYVFKTLSGDWTDVSLLHVIDNPEPVDGIRFGYRGVSISDKYAVVCHGLWGDTSGKAFVFDVDTGNLLHSIYNPNSYGDLAGDSFGYDCDITGNYVLIGAPYEESALGASPGVVYMYDLITGSLVHTIPNPNVYSTAIGDRFGTAIDAENNIFVTAASGEDDTSGNDSGVVCVYRLM